MKVIKIEKEKNSSIYFVTLKPSFIERMFGLKQKTIRYKDSGNSYKFGGGTAYIREDGELLESTSDIVKSIDNFRNQF